MEALLASCGVWVCAAAGEKYTNPNDTSRQPEIDLQPAASASFTPSNHTETTTVIVAVNPVNEVSVLFASGEHELDDTMTARRGGATQNPLQQIRKRGQPVDAMTTIKRALTLPPDAKFPSPGNKHPMDGFPQVCFIGNTVTNPNIVIGDYTYYDDPDDSENFERNVLYHFRLSATS